MGIQCVKKRDIDEALRIRQEQRVDPYRSESLTWNFVETVLNEMNYSFAAGFDHRSTPSTIDLNAVRLCFQVFLERTHEGKTTFSLPLTPVVSDIIYDKKAMSDLVICKLSRPSSSVAGGDEIILLCEKVKTKIEKLMFASIELMVNIVLQVTKEDIRVRFFETNNGQVAWEDFGEFQHSNVHKQVAISFRTPQYRSLEIDQPVKVSKISIGCRVIQFSHKTINIFNSSASFSCKKSRTVQRARRCHSNIFH